MAKFKLQAYSVDLYEDEIEAESAEKAQDVFMEKIENGDVAPEEGNVFFEGEDGFELLSELVAD